MSSMERECAEKFQAVADAVISEETQAAFEQRSVVPQTSDQFFVRDLFTGNLFHAEEAMTKLVLDSLTTQQRIVDNCLSATLESLIERVVKKVVRKPQKSPKLWKRSLTILDLLPQPPLLLSQNNIIILTRERRLRNTADNTSKPECNGTHPRHEPVGDWQKTTHRYPGQHRGK